MISGTSVRGKFCDLVALNVLDRLLSLSLKNSPRYHWSVAFRIFGRYDSTEVIIEEG